MSPALRTTALAAFGILLLRTGPAAAQDAPAPAPARVLTLAQAVAAARENQPKLRAARAGTLAARARADQALAPMLPQLGGTLSYGRGSTNRAGAANTWDSANQFNVGVTANQLVTDFGKTYGQYDAARESVQAQRGTEQATLDQVLLDVKVAFFQARAAKALVTVAREALDSQERHLAQIAGFVRVGTRPEIDLVQARADRANARVQLVNAENDDLSARAALALAMGVDTSAEDLEVADEPTPPVPGEDGTTETLLQEALAERPEFASLSAQLRAQEATRKSIRGQYAPSLGLSTSVTEGGSRLDEMAWNWNALVTLSWPFYQGGLTSARDREAKADLQALQAQVDQQRQQVRLEVEQARLGVRAAKAALEAVGDAVANARERLRLAEARYATGVGNAIELGDAQVARTTAEARQVQADFNLSAARARLVHALGRP